EGDLAEILAALAPGGVDEVAVDRQAEQLRIAIGEVARNGVEADDLGRADEGEILRPGEDHQPFAGIALVGHRREGRRVDAVHGGESEGREFVSYGQHRVLAPWFAWLP